MANVGYIRVSSASQNTDRQLAGVELDEVFQEKVSAKDAKRPVLQDCLRYLRDGAHREFFALVHAAEGAAVPGAVARQAQQQGAAAAFAGRPVHAGFEVETGVAGMHYAEDVAGHPVLS